MYAFRPKARVDTKQNRYGSSASASAIHHIPAVPTRSVSAADTATVVIVDDDKAIRETMRDLLVDQGYAVECFPDGADFLDARQEGQRGCILIDASMPAMSGLDVLQQLRARAVEMPAIMMSGHADLGMAVEAMKCGAVDFLAKPFSCNMLLASIRTALERAAVSSGESNFRRVALQRISTLTPRQLEILGLVVAGHPSKSIAADLCISQRTVDNHRAAIARKTCSKSLAHLIQTASSAGCGAEAVRWDQSERVAAKV